MLKSGGQVSCIDQYLTSSLITHFQGCCMRSHDRGSLLLFSRYYVHVNYRLAIDSFLLFF